MDKLASHMQELASRVPPLTNVNVVIYKNNEEGTLFEPMFLFGEKSKERGFWLVAGSRLQTQESPQEAVFRIVEKEWPGIKVSLKRLITAVHDTDDDRSWNVNLYYLCEYISGEIVDSDTFREHKWFTLQQLKGMDNVRVQDKRMLEDLDQTMTLVNSTQDEMLVQVDENDKDVGYISKKIAHSSNQVHHRASHIFLFNSSGEVVLQLRARTKSSHPLWRDMHGGHQVWGQTIDQCAAAELSEEVGISGDLRFHHKEHFMKSNQSEFAYCYTIIHDGPYGFDRNEVEELKAFSCQGILSGDYDDTYNIIPHVKMYLEKLRDIWEPLTHKK